MKRSKHNLSHYRMHTGYMGRIMPVCCVPVLPGDTVQHSTSALIRFSPLNTPVMHPVSVRIHHFFVPNRIIWPESEGGGWEQFITGGPDGNDNQTPPTVNVGSGTNASIMNYLGVPPQTPGQEVNALPLRAANKIWNEYYRDQDLQPERDLENDSTMWISWEKDYFTTARPWTQKGPDISLPLAGFAPVGTQIPNVQGNTVTIDDFDDGVSRLLNTDGGSGQDEVYVGAEEPHDARLWADLQNVSQISINDFRTGFALQRYQEARARYGSRFTEYLRYLGITPSDARLQRPEYLGGGVSRVSFSEVLQTTPAQQPNENGVGDLYGHGIAGLRTNRYRKFFEEHGYVITFLSIRPKATYLNGLHREFIKTTKEDYFQRELANLGQQEVFNAELNVDHNERLGVFGFQDRYHEYRSHPSFVAQEFRDELNTWHLARDIPDDVVLNSDFIDCNPSLRIFQVQDNDPAWIMVNNKMVARRMVPKRAFPRIL